MKTRHLAIALFAILVSIPTGSALAFSIRTTTDYAGQPLATGDTVAMNFLLDTEGENGIALLSVGVQWDPTQLALRTDLSNINLQVLYDPGDATTPETFLENGNVDPFALWTGITPPGVVQLNLDYAANLFTQRGAAGISSDELLASLVFEVIGASGTADIVTAIAAGNVLAIYSGGDFQLVTDELGVPSEPLTVSIGREGGGTPVPEPSAALLFAIGTVIFTARTRTRC